ncbi:MAG: aquaporin [Actinobacteria bacterium]|nr:aquaporin [Actinomycetota bacterium]
MAQVENSTPVTNADVAVGAPSLIQRLVAEFAGTFILVFSVIGTAAFSSNYIAVALAAGIAVLASAYAVGHISGGHFNPAVTLGAAASGRFAWGDVLPYIGAQVVGGALATTVLLGIRAGAGGDVFAAFSGTSNGYGEHSPGGFGLASVLLAEVVATAIFVYIILGVTDRRAPSGFAPLAIGLALAALHLVTIPVSNASLNPARSIATAIYGGGGALEQLWAFIVAPIVGALIAGFTYGFLFDRKRA